MKNFSVFKLRTTKELSVESPENALLRDIIRRLEEKGIECSKIRRGCLCIATICKLQCSLVAVALFRLQRKSDSYMHSQIWCHDYLPWWKKLIKRSCKPSDSGKELAQICESVQDILRHDERFLDVEWLTHEEWIAESRNTTKDNSESPE